MPPKKKGGKKKGDGDGGASGGDGKAAGPDPIMLTKEVEQLRGDASEARGRAHDLASEITTLKMELNTREKDTFEVVSFLRAENDRLKEQLASYERDVETARQEAEQEKERVWIESEEQRKQLEKTFEIRDQDREQEMQTLKAELEGLKDFKKNEKIIQKELETTRQELADQKAAHREAFNRLERKLIEEKTALQKEAEQQIADIRRRSEEEVFTRLDVATKRILQQNRKLAEDLRLHVKETESLTAEKAKLLEQNGKLKRDLSLHQQSVEEYGKHSHRQSREISDLTTKVRGLERSLSQVVRDFEKERDRVVAGHKQQVEDLEMENGGLRKVLNTKEREGRKIKRLAGDILSQRSEVEQFFIDALDEVKSQIRKKRGPESAGGGGKSFFLTQANEYGTRGGLSFPSIKGQGTAEDPGAAGGRVDIKDLDWQDKERVLRLLFARINQAQTKRATVAAAPERPSSQPVSSSSSRRSGRVGHQQGQSAVQGSAGIGGRADWE